MMTVRLSQMPMAPMPSLKPFNDGDIRLAAAFAHGLKAIAPAGTLQGVEQGRHELRPRRADRVAERDGAAADIDLLMGNAEFLHPGQRHRCERLVAFEQVDIVEL